MSIKKHTHATQRILSAVSRYLILPKSERFVKYVKILLQTPPPPKRLYPRKYGGPRPALLGTYKYVPASVLLPVLVPQNQDLAWPVVRNLSIYALFYFVLFFISLAFSRAML